MFIAKDYDLQLEAPGCSPGSEEWNASARFGEDLSDVFPYLNAEWKDVIYSPGAQQMTLRMEGHSVALHARKIIISGLPDRDSATILMEKIVAEINRIWMERDKITPLYTARKRLVAMSVYQFLPQTNCKACGAPTCFAFATKLTVGELEAEDCTPLFEDEAYADKRQGLLDMIEAATG